MESLFLSKEFFEAAVYHHGQLVESNSFKLWAFSCEFGMPRLLKKVEDALVLRRGVERSLRQFGSEEAFSAMSSRGLHAAAISLLSILKASTAAATEELRVAAVASARALEAAEREAKAAAEERRQEVFQELGKFEWASTHCRGMFCSSRVSVFNMEDWPRLKKFVLDRM